MSESNESLQFEDYFEDSIGNLLAEANSAIEAAENQRRVEQRDLTESALDKMSTDHDTLVQAQYLLDRLFNLTQQLSTARSETLQKLHDLDPDRYAKLPTSSDIQHQIDQLNERQSALENPAEQDPLSTTEADSLEEFGQQITKIEAGLEQLAASRKKLANTPENEQKRILLKKLETAEQKLVNKKEELEAQRENWKKNQQQNEQRQQEQAEVTEQINQLQGALSIVQGYEQTNATRLDEEEKILNWFREADFASLAPESKAEEGDEPDSAPLSALMNMQQQIKEGQPAAEQLIAESLEKLKDEIKTALDAMHNDFAEQAETYELFDQERVNESLAAYADLLKQPVGSEGLEKRQKYIRNIINAITNCIDPEKLQKLQTVVDSTSALQGLEEIGAATGSELSQEIQKRDIEAATIVSDYLTEKIQELMLEPYADKDYYFGLIQLVERVTNEKQAATTERQSFDRLKSALNLDDYATDISFLDSYGLVGSESLGAYADLDKSYYTMHDKLRKALQDEKQLPEAPKEVVDEIFEKYQKLQTDLIALGKLIAQASGDTKLVQNPTQMIQTLQERPLAIITQYNESLPSSQNLTELSKQINSGISELNLSSPKSLIYRIVVDGEMIDTNSDEYFDLKAKIEHVQSALDRYRYKVDQHILNVEQFPDEMPAHTLMGPRDLEAYVKENNALPPVSELRNLVARSTMLKSTSGAFVRSVVEHIQTEHLTAEEVEEYQALFDKQKQSIAEGFESLRSVAEKSPEAVNDETALLHFDFLTEDSELNLEQHLQVNEAPLQNASDELLKSFEVLGRQFGNVVSALGNEKGNEKKFPNVEKNALASIEVVFSEFQSVFRESVSSGKSPESWDSELRALSNKIDSYVRMPESIVPKPKFGLGTKRKEERGKVTEQLNGLKSYLEPLLKPEESLWTSLQSYARVQPETQRANVFCQNLRAQLQELSAENPLGYRAAVKHYFRNPKVDFLQKSGRSVSLEETLRHMNIQPPLSESPADLIESPYGNLLDPETKEKLTKLTEHQASQAALVDPQKEHNANLIKALSQTAG